MGKKNKIEYSLMPANVIDDTGRYYVLADSGDGYQHEYTIKVLEVESGTLYMMEYANSITWSEELRGVNIFHLLNTGDNYQWISTDPMNSTIEYDDFYMYTVFFRVIQKLESSNKFRTRVLETRELTKFNF